METGNSRKVKIAGCTLSRYLIVLTFSILLSASGIGSAWSAPDADMRNGWFVNMKAFSASAHASIACENCHGDMTDGATRPHPDTDHPDFLTSNPRDTFDYASCRPCHRKSYERYLQGEHAKVLTASAAPEPAPTPAKPPRKAPTCGHCHSAHYAKAHLTRVETGRQMTAQCGSCHPDQQKSYLENYHGKTAVNLGYDKAALCTDCHGAHTVLSLENPDQRLTACRRCHPDARAEFANIVIHYSHNAASATEDVSKKTRLTRIGLISTLSLVFIVAVLVFFYSHTFLLMLRKIHDKLRKNE